MQELGQVDGICSFWEAAQALVATLAERVGLLSHPPGAVENAREKQVGLTLLLVIVLDVPSSRMHATVATGKIVAQGSSLGNL